MRSMAASSPRPFAPPAGAFLSSPGAGSNNTREAIALAGHAERAGADGLLMVTPYYNKPNQEGLYLHFKAINDAVSIPIIIYNIPPRSVIDMSVETMKRLSEFEEHRRREGCDRQYRAHLAATRGDGAGFHPAFRRRSHRARLYGGWRAWLYFRRLEHRAAALRRFAERLPCRRISQRRWRSRIVSCRCMSRHFSRRA